MALMPKEQRIGYIYLTRIQTSRRVLRYVGKKHSSEFDKEYYGSGRVVSFIKKKRGKDKMKTRAIAWARTEEELNATEKELIAKARLKFGKLCVNSSDGGDGLSPAVARKVLNRPSVKARQIAGIKFANADPELNARRSVAMKSLLSSPEKKAMLSKRTKMAWADPEGRKRRVNSLNKAAQKPEVKAKISAALKRRLSDPANKQHLADASKAAWSNPEYKSRMAEIRKAMWADPAFKARRAKAHSLATDNDEYRTKLANAAKAMWADPEARKRMIAAQKAKWEKRKASNAGGQGGT